MGGTRLKIFIAPKNFCDFRQVHEKTFLKLAQYGKPPRREPIFADFDPLTGRFLN
jgi:hypothetical protein